jgi:ligand-binding sensor domain-containing protein
MTTKNSALAILLSVLSLICHAQVPFFQQYYLLKKNEPVQTNAIFQDRDGFMWFGTNKGLFRFDGKRYRHYTRADSLPDERVTAIAQDADGKIWTGHKNGRLAFIDKGTFSTFDPPEGAVAAPVSDILFDKKGNLWFSTLNDGLYYFTRNRLYRLDETEGMPDLFVYDMLEDSLGQVWAGTDGGIAVCNLQNDKVSIRVLDNNTGLVDNIVKKLALAEDQAILIGTEDAGIIRHDVKKNTFQPLIAEPWTLGSVTDFVMKGSQVWIATSQAGLFLHDRETGVLKEYSRKTGAELATFSTLLKDREGNIWAGSRSGVVRTPGDILEFIKTPVADGDRNVMAIAVDQTSAIWFSTKDGLFKRRKTGTGAFVVEKQLTSAAYRNYRVISLYVDHEGQVWAGLYGEGALRINPATGKVRHLNRELRNGNVLHISGKGNVVWLATLGGSEKITVSGNRLAVQNYNSQNGLSSDFIYQVFIDSQDRVWFGTDGKGVDMLDHAGFHHFEKGLTSRVVYGFAEDNKKQIWVNTQDDGIYQWNGTTFVHAPEPHHTQFREQTIHSVAADRAGNLVVMHDLGIDIYNVQQGTMRYLSEEAGLESQVANLNAIAHDQFGNILAGTDGGIIRYAPRAEQPRLAPKVFIDAVKVFGKEVDIKRSPGLRYDENSITVHFLGFWYDHPESVHFQYKMDNHDPDWMTTADNNVTYSQLAPGDYTLRLRAATATLAGAEEAVLHFKIYPPFWRTPLFYLASVVLVLLAGYVYIKYREKTLLEAKLLLEEKVEERTLEIQRKTEEIQAQNEEIMAQAEEIKGINENLEMLVYQRTAELEKKNKALEEYAFINAHKLRSPLASILGLINLISKTDHDHERKVINQHLHQRANELDDVIRSITKAIEQGEK